MNKSKRIKASLCLLLIFLYSLNSFSQSKNFNCEVYKKILIHLNEEKGKIKYVYRGPVDPTSPTPGKKVKLDAMLQYKFLVVDTLYFLDTLADKKWLADELKEPRIETLSFTHSKGSTFNCTISNDIKYRICSYKEATEGTKAVPTTEKIGNVTKQFTPTRIRFSNVIYNPKYVLVTAKIKEGMNSEGDVVLYGFLLKKSGETWKVDKEFHRFLR